MKMLFPLFGVDELYSIVMLKLVHLLYDLAKNILLAGKHTFLLATPVRGIEPVVTVVTEDDKEE